jgi:high-affinity iron transporter
MLQAFVITLREGLESFLIVAITFAYLRKTKRHRLLPAVLWGIATSVLLSLGVAVLFRRASNQALWEGMLALVAAVLVASLTVHMWRVGRRMKGEIETRLEIAASRTGARAWVGVFVFTLLMITREGMETVVLLGALLFQVQSVNAIAGAFAGILCAAVIAWLWARYGHRINLGRFFQVSAIFLLVFSLQLIIYGFHELTEAAVIPYSEPLHWATEPYGPDGRYGKSLSYLLVLLPLGWLGVTLWLDRTARPHTVSKTEV